MLEVTTIGGQYFSLASAGLASALITGDGDWGDGLPMIAPVREDVEALCWSWRSLGRDLPPVPPRWLSPTLESIAANAIMAGCLPQHFPFVVAALSASLADEHNLHGVLATTHPCGSLIIVNGPARSVVGINCSTNCMSSSARANAVIGHALRLAHVNIGGALSPEMDKATHGSPAKLGFCFGENEERSPWDPYHVRHGFDRNDDVVTVVAAESTHNVNDHTSTTGDGIITTIAGTMSQPGSNQVYLTISEHFLVIGPEHAATMYRDGWTVDSIREALYERSRVPVSQVSKDNQMAFLNRGKEPVEDFYYLGSGPEALHVLVAGGPGKHSVWIPTFGSSRAVSRRVIAEPARLSPPRE